MNVVVTGATGFIGRCLIRRLLSNGHKVVAVARDEAKARSLDWYHDVTFKARDVHSCDAAELVAEADLLLHLAWPGLPNYSGRFHFEETLPRDYAFLRAAVQGGVRRLLVTGTCLEYGPDRSGRLSEAQRTDPRVPYAIAKDSLRRFLTALQREVPFALQWARVFYMFGPGQNAASLLSQLDRAIAEGRSIFEMSGGEQLRDFSHVNDIAAMLALLVEHPEAQGVINCCSGRPISVRGLVERHLRERGADIQLKLGVYPYPDYEPFAFWGADDRIASLAQSAGHESAS